MTLATFISPVDFDALIDAAFQSETPRVASSESDIGEPLQWFQTAAEVKAKAAQCADADLHNYAFGLWYPSMRGQMLERRVELDPPRDGKSFRYSLGGWGLIRLHLYFTQIDTLQCRVSVNSEARALSRQDRHPELGAVSDWNWRAVETHAFGLTRRLATMGKTGPVLQPAAPGTGAVWPGRS